MHLMHAVEHSLRIRVARSLELMAAPLVVGPVVPVLHDVVHGDMTTPELRERLLDVAAGLVAFPALPES